MPANLHSAHILLGSNIQPEENIRRGLLELCHYGILRRVSRAWQTPAQGSQGPDFINLAVELSTPFNLDALKKKAIAEIESRLGRQRSADKNAPRTIDLDIILFDGKLLDQSVWTSAHIAITIAELLPDLQHPQSRLSLKSCAAKLVQGMEMHGRPDILPPVRQ